MRPFRFIASESLRACALLLTLFCALAHAQPAPSSVTIIGSLQSELGCPSDWAPACANTHLDLNSMDGVWRKVFHFPVGTYAFKAAINDSWDENYGANGRPGGADLQFQHSNADIGVKFYYDPETHWVTNSVLTSIAVVAGSLQSELGCPGDWQPGCMLTWLKDVDGDGVQELRILSLPEGSYQLKIAHHEGWDENYGRDGVYRGEEITLNVPAPNQAIRFRYDLATHRLAINIAAPTTTTLAASSNPVPQGAQVTLTSTVAMDLGTDIPTGTVTFKADGEELGTAPLDSEGVATLTPDALPLGTYSLTAEYSGNYESSTSIPIILRVGAPTSDTDAGSGSTDAGPGETDAGTGNTDAGSGQDDAGTTPGNDAGTQGPDAGTSNGNTDAGTNNPPAEGDETSGCGCGAGSGGSSTLMLGMWLGLTVIRSRRRANAQARR